MPILSSPTAPIQQTPVMEGAATDAISWLAGERVESGLSWPESGAIGPGSSIFGPEQAATASTAKLKSLVGLFMAGPNVAVVPAIQRAGEHPVDRVDLLQLSSMTKVGFMSR